MSSKERIKSPEIVTWYYKTQKGKKSTFIILKRSVTSRFYGSNISAFQQSFLTETAIFIVELPFCSWV